MEEEDEVVPTAESTESREPEDLARAAVHAAWQAQKAVRGGNGVSAQRWSNVSEAFHHALEAVLATSDGWYAVKEKNAAVVPDSFQGPPTGTLTNDEIQTVMALRRGDATVVKAERSHDTEDTDDKPEYFESWARRQIQKQAEIIRIMRAEMDSLRNGITPHAGERRVDPLGIGSQIDAEGLGDATGLDGGGRAMWALMEAAGVRSQVIPQETWLQARYGQVAITTRSDGSRIIRRS